MKEYEWSRIEPLLQAATDLCAAVDFCSWEALSGGEYKCNQCQCIMADGDPHPQEHHRYPYHLAQVLMKKLSELGFDSNYPEITP